MSSTMVVGLALLIYSLRSGVHQVLFVAFAAIGASVPGNLAVFHVSNLFPGREGLVLGLINGSFDASSVIFVTFSAAVAGVGVDLSTVVLAYLICPVVVLLFTSCVLWRDTPFTPYVAPPEATAAAEEATGEAPSPTTDQKDAAPALDDEKCQGASTDTAEVAPQLCEGSTEGPVGASGESTPVAAGCRPALAIGTSCTSYQPSVEIQPTHASDASSLVVLTFPDSAADPSSSNAASNATKKKFNRSRSVVMGAIDGVDYETLQALPFRQQICTAEFLTYLAFHVVAIVHLAFFFGSERCVDVSWVV